MAIRSSMADLIARVRTMIFDGGANPFFDDQQIQDVLDEHRDDVRAENLIIAPSIVNNANTNNMADTVYADFYSKYQWWESDVTLQAMVNTNGVEQAWIVVTPVTSDYIVGHWQFETNVFTTGTAPGQLPPVFATGKIYDRYAAAADLLEFWAAALTGSYDVTVDGQNLRRSQLPLAKQTLADRYRMRAKPKMVKMVREDVAAPISSREMRLLDASDTVK